LVVGDEATSRGVDPFLYNERPDSWILGDEDIRAFAEKLVERAASPDDDIPF
jgi:hypothetical protein